MKKAKSGIGKILKIAALALAALLLLFFMARFVGQTINRRTPEGGINESMFVEINGVKQWISIYGRDLDNPVLLYLHGGPGSATSMIDYAFTRKWADVYTVVTWDQRDCGKSAGKDGAREALSYDLLMSDGKAMTEFILDYLHVDRLTLLGHSWGTYYGCNLVLADPEYYDCYIGTGQLVDMRENEEAFREAAVEWVGNDPEGLELLRAITPDHLTMEHFNTRNLLMEKYGYGMMRDGTDYCLPAAVIFNPYYSLADWLGYLNYDPSEYMTFLMSEEFERFSLKGRTAYEVPFYNINGGCDYQTNFQLAQAYFDEVDAPYKRLFVMEDTTHGLLESKSEEFSGILHEIAAERAAVK